MNVETVDQQLVPPTDLAKESDPKTELREMIQEITQYTIDHVVVEGLLETEERYQKTLPKMDHQINSLREIVKLLEKEKETLLVGIEAEHKLLVQDRERVQEIIETIVSLSENSQSVLLNLQNENGQLKQFVQEVMSENVAIKATISSILAAVNTVETKQVQYTETVNRLIDTTDAGFEVSHTLRGKNHRFTLFFMFSLLIGQFGILAYLLV